MKKLEVRTGKKILAGAVLTFSTLFMAGVSLATTLSLDYSVVENNSPTIDLSGQLETLVTIDNDTNTATFKVWNDVGLQSSITDIYFDYPADDEAAALSGWSFTDSGAGVDFASPASPGELPGNGSISFTTDYSAGATPPPYHSGLNLSTEWILFSANIYDGYDLYSALLSGAVRVGLKLQGLSDGASETYVSHVSPVPVPAAAWLFGSALLGFMATRRRKNS